MRRTATASRAARSTRSCESSPPRPPGVELIAGWTAVGLLGNGRPTGVRIEDRAHERRDVKARLVVAADGRDSKVARWARVPGPRQAPPALLLLGLLERAAPGHRALEDVAARSGCGLHVPQRGRPDGRAAGAAPRSPGRVPIRPAGRIPPHRQRAARRPGPERSDARVQTARKARAAQRVAARRAPRAWRSSETRRWPPTRCGESAAAGPSRAPTGWCRRPPTR